MSAITGTAVTNIAATRNSGVDVSAAAMTVATNSGTLVTDTETFDITVAKRDAQFVILVANGCGATVTASVLGGDMWMGSTDMTAVSIATAKTYAFVIDSAKFKKSTGKISVKITPTAGTALNASSKVAITALTLA